MPKSEKDVNREKFLQLADLLAKDPVFCALVKCEDPEARIPQSELLGDFIVAAATKSGYKIRHTATAVQDFHSRLCATTPNELSPAAIQLMQLFKGMYNTNRRRFKARQHRANRIGFKHPTKLSKRYVEKLEKPYPPPKHIILEQNYNPFPPPPPLIDCSCTYTSDYHNLDESCLQYTIEANESCIFYEKTTRRPVAIVVRDLAMDYFDIIQPWAASLVKDSISRRVLSRRNNPQLAQVGISSGSRSAGLFGWVRNIKPRYKNATDAEQHEHDISSFFGLFYALIRSRLPCFVKDTFENTVQKSGICKRNITGDIAGWPAFEFQLRLSDLFRARV